MLLTIPLSPDTESKLKQRAAANGREVGEYAAKLLEEAITHLTMDEILAPIHKQVAESGMSEDQVMEFGQDLLHKVRAERKAKAP